MRNTNTIHFGKITTTDTKSQGYPWEFREHKSESKSYQAAVYLTKQISIIYLNKRMHSFNILVLARGQGDSVHEA